MHRLISLTLEFCRCHCEIIHLLNLLFLPARTSIINDSTSTTFSVSATSPDEQENRPLEDWQKNEFGSSIDWFDNMVWPMSPYHDFRQPVVPQEVRANHGTKKTHVTTVHIT